jgi:hypothetical protein
MTTTVRQREVDRHVAEQTEITHRQRIAAISEAVIAEARIEQAIAACVAAGDEQSADRFRTALVIVESTRRGLVP